MDDRLTVRCSRFGLFSHNKEGGFLLAAWPALALRAEPTFDAGCYDRVREFRGGEFTYPSTVLGQDCGILLSQFEIKKKCRYNLTTAEAKEGVTSLRRLFPPVGKDIIDGHGLLPISVATKSTQSEIAALLGRVLMAVPAQSDQGGVLWTRGSSYVLESVRSRLADSGLEPWSMRRTLRHMVERHGAGLYVQAWQSLRLDPFNKEDAKVTLFVKVEKALDDGQAMKPPRAIQFRGPRFNLLVGKYLCPFEHVFCSTFSKPNGTGLHTSKGLNPDARARLMVELWERRAAPAALCIDASRFDAHVTSQMLAWEHLVYLDVYGCQASRLFRRLLELQKRNKGRTMSGIKYSVEGTRMSGDVNTSLGNSLIEMAVLKSVSSSYDVDILVEGDDAVIFGSVRDIAKLEETIGPDSLSLGMKLKVQRASCLEEIEYCSARLVEVSSGVWKSVRHYTKALVTDIYTHRQNLSVKAVVEKARVVAVCHSLGYSGIPVLSAWAAYLLSHTSAGKKLDQWYDRQLWLMAKARCNIGTCSDGGPVRPETSFSVDTVTQVARESFYCAFGIMPSEQRLLEQSLLARVGPFPPCITEEEIYQLLGGTS